MSEQDQPPITVALVTGASHGIGLEVARQLAESEKASSASGGFFRDGEPAPW